MDIKISKYVLDPDFIWHHPFFNDCEKLKKYYCRMKKALNNQTEK